MHPAEDEITANEAGRLSLFTEGALQKGRGLLCSHQRGVVVQGKCQGQVFRENISSPYLYLVTPKAKAWLNLNWLEGCWVKPCYASGGLWGLTQHPRQLLSGSCQQLNSVLAHDLPWASNNRFRVA